MCHSSRFLVYGLTEDNKPYAVVSGTVNVLIYSLNTHLYNNPSVHTEVYRKHKCCFIPLVLRFKSQYDNPVKPQETQVFPSHGRKITEPQRRRPTAVETTQHPRQIQTQPQTSGTRARVSIKGTQKTAESEGVRTTRDCKQHNEGHIRG